ncbi:hypothetical protein CDQ92_13305 [Sphingopyxis bauzanensis]|uniref:Uncharacterized protein n=1 Tax=Sphingopyxis bauzanensis TaxID=651663 RepID=A0A246JRW5_9SPHN|nr:hypothetical protein [Sphingopyxis bauzanensis]OWQ95754.1 hypothetical protein CDQ92_13305 [Sphingopyxis bauzanensis]GGJ39764.1 hypothetical protein GCM10011393_07500 [Sphingopyxis bauzanensis]
MSAAKCRCEPGDIFQCVACAEATSNPLLEAAIWAADNYENININHVDYRVEVKRRMDDAIAKSTGGAA